MDLRQQKLTKSEWELEEIPVNVNEKKILDLIYNGYSNVNHTYNDAMSLMGYMKIIGSNAFHLYFYENYFKETIDKIKKRYNIECDLKGQIKKLKKSKH